MIARTIRAQRTAAICQPKNAHAMKSTKYLLLISLILTPLGFLAGCTANYPHRTYIAAEDYPKHPDTNRPKGLPPIDSTTNAAVETRVVPYLNLATGTPTNAAYKIGYVEFDDQGWFWSHNQWSAVTNELGKEANVDDANSPGVTVLVFVHGWNNNADHDNPNVELFRGALAGLSTNLAPRKVFGIYVSWRGQSCSIPVIQYLSFYHRKEVAERIGHQGAATQVFSELENVPGKVQHQPPDDWPPNEVDIHWSQLWLPASLFRHFTAFDGAPDTGPQPG